MTETPTYDLLVIGGGINGAGIARDAAGRGLSVLLVEQDDLAGHTSSASTKLIHGGLRYLEYAEFRLVRESLLERERLLGLAPHIIWPLTFVLPHRNSVRPAWMVRLGLFLYDHLGGRERLPASRTIRLDRSPLGEGLDPTITKAFTYADCWVEDSRLVVLNAIDAAERGATILTDTRFVSAERSGGGWTATIEDKTGTRTISARAIVNAAGPWVAEVIGQLPGITADRGVRLVKGSHIVVPRLHHGDHALMLQNPDKRIVFVIPYEREFSLIGTTDEAWEGALGKVAISDAENDYLCTSVNRYFTRQITPGDVAWSYAGIRPLYDDHEGNASAVTRDYVLDLDAEDGAAPLLSVFGGKITTFRKLAEHALDKLDDYLKMGPRWTATAPLPGGDIADFEVFAAKVADEFPFLPAALAWRLARAYGTRIAKLLGDSRDLSGLGTDFGGGLFQAEVDYLIAHEWARTSEDILYRRSKLGLHVSRETVSALDAYLQSARAIPR